MAVWNLTTKTWSLLKDQFHGGDAYWAGHEAVGNGRFVNDPGSACNGNGDSRGTVVRNPDNLAPLAAPPPCPSATYIMQPPTPYVGFYDGEHLSWFNSASNATAPVLLSRFSVPNPPAPLPAWSDEISAAATDGSNTVWRFAHNHNGYAARQPILGANAFYHQAFAQISPDGKYAVFPSYWGGTLGLPPVGDLDPAYRIDTFIVELPLSSFWDPNTAVNVALNGNVLTKNGGCDGCNDTGASSIQQIPPGNGYVEFTASETNTYRGLGLSHLHTGTDCTTIDFLVFLTPAATASVYEGCVWQADAPGTYVSGATKFRIAIVNGQVQYSKDGTVFYSHAVTPAYPLAAYALLETYNPPTAVATITNAVLATGP